MNILFKKILFVVITIICFSAFISMQRHLIVTPDKGLKDYYKNYFPIGVAVNVHNLSGREARLILKEFNSLTPENDMKVGPIHPFPNVYNWGNADSIVSFAKHHYLKVRGHNLCWYKQVADWFFVDHHGKVVSKDTLLQRLKQHILTVVNRYKQNVYAWDVVNEAVSDDDSVYLRNSKWLKICGEDYIDSAFSYAHTADPKAQLFYNDYNVVVPQKREKIYKLLKGLIAKGIPVSGIGIQAHWSVNRPTREDLEQTIQLFASLGLKIQITELDISLYSGRRERVFQSSGDENHYKDSLNILQQAKYKMIFDVFRKYKKYINGVTFWNLSDRYTWLNHYPLNGRWRNYPLLFDTLLQRKPAYWDVVNWR